MNEQTKRMIAWALVVVAIIAAGFLGVQYPIPEPPDMADYELRLTALETSGVVNYSATGSGEGYTNLTSLALEDDLYVGDDATVVGDLDSATFNATGDVDFDSTVNVDGAATLNSTLDVDGAVTLNSTLDVDGNITSGTGAVTITDSVNITGAVDVDSTLNADGAVTLNSTLDVDGNVSSGTGAFTVADSIAITGLFYPSFADETITDGETLTPTVTVYALDSAGAVTMTLAASGVEGQLLILIGDDANDITINDTNIRTNDGAAQVLNQYDVLMLVYQDSEWIEISNSDNS